ncbi:Stk1 family PASTA domain-containing Ser/Thr kinase [Demequina activiva]|uniref:non-specific serine/threonine protein kinase n=1 Tax=Demequina activiva TaxID=1582364 RepID=A0A919Q295_9MICO|nr:Stk1 family PASTA domain-containing Ser/Thr kinase [Demequina activiva]GIG54709.1 serine/threonine protein kinase [Demequina activiva]
MSDTMTDPLIGRLIDGRYEVRERVAAGGMATVYVAHDQRLERDVALKVMHPHLAADASEADFVTRFQKEAKAAARLTHPGMVRVYDQGVDGPLSYLTMEYVEGENLRQRMAHEGTLTVGEALTVTESVLDALAAAHRKGLVHRDVKPENVLLDETDQPKLADFGLARAVTEVTSTTTGMLLGTVAYLAPELVSDGEADARTDVYSCGILLFEMVTGRQPFTAQTALGVASRHVHEDVPPPSATVPWLPAEFDALVATMAAREAASRPDDAAAALALVRQTRAMIDDPTLDRRADPPSGATALVHDDGATTVLDDAPSGSTVALPIGLGGTAVAVDVLDAELMDDDPEAIEPEQPSHRAGWWLGAALATLLVLGSLGFWWYNSVGPGAFTTVPSVAGVAEDGARATLEGLDFVVEIERQYDDTVAAGTAIGTDPGEQTRAPDGSEITLIVSRGARQETIPDVIGMTEAEAIEALGAVGETGFPVGDSTLTYSDTVPAGEVMGVTPGVGETVRHDLEVTLEVSDGPEPIEIPDLTGMTEQEAIAALAQFAIEPTVEYGRTEDVATGEVFAQDPAGGSEGLRTQDVTITVSEGLPLVTVEDVRGMFFDEAKATLEGLGLTVTGDDNPWNFSTVVFNMDPAPNSEVEQGSQVYLEY